MTTTQTHLFRFTPSMMPSETLERLLVQRQALAQRLSDLIRESVTSQNKHHKLLIGPRGMGKTYLVALTYHRVKAMNDLRENLWIAWLNEEEWGVDSYLDLLLRICRALQGEYPSLFPSERMEALYQMTPADAQRAAERLLKEFIGDRTLVLLMENLDEIFKGIGDKGQRQFRAFLQENGFSTILATSQSLFNGVSRQTSPFYGFFSVTHLQEFSVEDATNLLQNIAAWKQDRELVEFIETPAGRARVRAVNHLAGGNPRVYVIFSEFLTRESLDVLVEPFLKTLDEMTPYYQARIGAISTQQRKIVEFLCDHAAPATVKEIAKCCFITQQTASSQLKDLKEKGYVIADPLGPTGRDTYYELKEPLMRLCLEVKKSRTGPIRLLVDFLRLWYPVTELKQQLNLCKPEATKEREYLQLAIQAAEQTDDPRVKACRYAFDNYMNSQRFEQALTVAEELIAIDPVADSFIYRSISQVALNRSQEALNSVSTALRLHNSDAAAWLIQSAALAQLGRLEEAVASAKQATVLQPKNPFCWLQLSSLYKQQDLMDQCLQTLNNAIQTILKNADLWKAQGTTLEEMGRLQEALTSYSKAVKLSPHDEDAWVRKAFTLQILWRNNEAVCCYDKAIQRNPQSGLLWFQKGALLGEMRHYDRALTCFEESIKLNERADCAYYDRSWAIMITQSFDTGLRCLEEAIDLHPLNKEHLAGHTWIIMHALFNSGQMQAWNTQIQKIVDLYSRRSIIETLSPALLQNVAEDIVPTTSYAATQAWYESWKAAAGDRPEFDLPLRLMDTAIRYKATNDKRILLKLPSEERKILEPLLNVAKHDSAEEKDSSEVQNDALTERLADEE